MLAPIISADSHVIEPPEAYLKMDKKFRDRAPHLVHDPKAGDLYAIPGLDKPIPPSLLSGAGKKPEELAKWGGRWEECHRGAWDPKVRVADQERDGLGGEVLYASVGMLLCTHPDFEYKSACFKSYNEWVSEFCSYDPKRLIGLGQTAMNSVEEGIEDLQRIKQLGLRGVMMPGNPRLEDYDSKIYDPFWEAAIDLQLPPSFHIAVSKEDKQRFHVRGVKLNSFHAIIRACQDIIGMLVLGGVFERHPKLKVVCAEADAGWMPHYMMRMDHAYNRHRFDYKYAVPLSKKPSEYLRENVYLTFQDDWSAILTRHLMNVRRLLWASDFPHSDSTWPWSREVIDKGMAEMSEQEKNLLLHDSAAELYHLN